MTTAAPARWPKLSDTLTGPRDPRICQGCGAGADQLPGLESPPVELHAWVECDDQDRGTAVTIIVCPRCEKLIKPHPRLYRPVEHNEPRPGIMELCVPCRYRSGTSCSHPSLKANGGSGLLLTIERPTPVHLCYGGGRGEFKKIWPKPVEACAGREVAA